MAYTLGNTTIPKPNSMARRFVETSEANTVFNGTTKRRVVNLKEQYVLKYVLLDLDEVGRLVSAYELNTPLDFAVDDGEMQVATTTVLVDIQSREYNAIDPDFREDLTLILTEVL